MTFLGGLLIFGSAYLISHDHDAGLVGFLESWALIGAGVMGGGIAGIFSSLPALTRKYLHEIVDEGNFDGESTEADAEAFLNRHMNRWGWTGALVGGVIGALLAMAVV